MQPVDALTESSRADASQSADAATAAYWLAHPDPPPALRRKSFADLIDQWESEPEWTPENDACPE